MRPVRRTRGSLVMLSNSTIPPASPSGSSQTYRSCVDPLAGFLRYYRADQDSTSRPGNGADVLEGEWDSPGSECTDDTFAGKGRYFALSPSPAWRKTVGREQNGQRRAMPRITIGSGSHRWPSERHVDGSSSLPRRTTSGLGSDVNDGIFDARNLGLFRQRHEDDVSSVRCDHAVSSCGRFSLSPMPFH